MRISHTRWISKAGLAGALLLGGLSLLSVTRPSPTGPLACKSTCNVGLNELCGSACSCSAPDGGTGTCYATGTPMK